MLLEKRAFQNDDEARRFAFFLRAFFLSLFLSLKNGISLSLSFAFLSFYCALFERL